MRGPSKTDLITDAFADESAPTGFVRSHSISGASGFYEGELCTG